MLKLIIPKIMPDFLPILLTDSSKNRFNVNPLVGLVSNMPKLGSY